MKYIFSPSVVFFSVFGVFVLVCKFHEKTTCSDYGMMNNVPVHFSVVNGCLVQRGQYWVRQADFERSTTKEVTP